MRPFRVLERVSKTLCIFHSFIEICFWPCSGAVDIALSKIPKLLPWGSWLSCRGQIKKKHGRR